MITIKLFHPIRGGLNSLVTLAIVFGLASTSSIWAETASPVQKITPDSLGLNQDQSGIITKQYDDGSVYKGTFRYGKPHGVGSFQLTNGYNYTGDWVDGVISGMGEARYTNGAVYS
ncbi:MAG: hypothetical protein QMC17_01145, partial [Paracoccaceae bacterium]